MGDSGVLGLLERGAARARAFAWCMRNVPGFASAVLVEASQSNALLARIVTPPLVPVSAPRWQRRTRRSLGRGISGVARNGHRP